MKKIKNNKGIALVSLTIAVIIMLVITSMLVYETKNGIRLRNLKKMQNDIDLLSNEISAYYNEYGDIPAEIEYLGEINFEKQPNDDDKYYVIDLSAFEDITLNYGLDYNNITSSADTVNLTDVYIVNKQSMHVYYAKGIAMDGIMYYTNDEDEKIKLYDEPVDTPEVSTEPSFSRAYGVIEIEFLKGTTYMPTTTPNEPNMTDDMKAVYWENGEEKVEGESEDFDKNKWYEYVAQTTNTETGGTSKWANAQTSDGSYWVWIPRYAYRIVYFDTEAHRDAYRADNTQTEGIIGYSDARGLVNADGKTPSDLQEPVTSVGVGTNLLRPHPAFEDGTKTGFTQGEWDTKLEGIWVAKYEMSQSETTVKSIPGVRSYRNISIGNMYTKSYDYDREKESHMMKNSEWGAMAYLTDSKYGRNGTRITKNDNSENYTGGEKGATELTNPLQSTTGNEYGIFDTAGGANEYVSAYIADSTRNDGNSFASIDDTTNNKQNSTKYATVYKMSSLNTSLENYNINKNKMFGDATIEISYTGIGVNGWNNSGSTFFGIFDESTGGPFCWRGGNFGATQSNIFYFTAFKGNSGVYNSFRVCLSVN